MTKTQYYSLKNILQKKAVYNIIIGERSNGKTYAVLREGVRKYLNNEGQVAYIRRWKEDVTGRRAKAVFSALEENNEIYNLSNGEFTGVHYLNGRFYLCNYDEKGNVVFSDNDCFGFLFALSDSEHDKSTSYPNVTTIIFDEFLTKNLHLNDEFIIFMNVISTIIRKRTDVKIFMLGNTVNKYSPYFLEMGLNHIPKMEQGTIDVYKYGNSKLTVAVEYCKPNQTRKKNNFYFAFNNPKLEMITGGAWEMNIYTHLPIKYKPKNIDFIYFIKFNDKIYQCEIITINDISFTYIHNKTTPIKDDDNEMIYSLEYNAKINYNRNIFKPINKLQQNILWYFKTDRVFYQDNFVGDEIGNYLKLCGG